MTRIPRWLHRPFPLWTLPVALLILALAAYGPLLPRLGFYWDDWAQLFSYRVSGPAGFWSYFASDRPFSAWTSALFSPLLGESALGWHLFTLALRCLTALAFWLLLRRIWPGRVWAASLAALLFLVYPAFSQQSIGVAYHQHWLQYLLFMLSLLVSVVALRRPRGRIPLVLLALLLQALQLSITEYFVFSELLRPAIFWLIYANESWRDHPARRGVLLRAAAKAFLTALPYLALLGGYAVWRLALQRLPGDPNQPLILQQIFRQPLAALEQLARSALWDELWIVLASWGRAFALSAEQTAQPFTLAAWGLGFLAGLGAALYLARLSLPTAVETAPHPTLQMLALAALALLLGPAPSWVLRAETILTDADPYHSDRFALAAMLGAALLFAALVDWAGRGRLQKAALAGLLIGLAVSYQLRAANEFRWLWVEQSRFFQQLAWRAPALAPGTALITEEVIFPYQGNFSTASALNLLYPQTRWPAQVDYWVYALLPRLDDHLLEDGPANLKTRMRTSQFSGSTARGVLVSSGKHWQTCLWVLRPVDRYNPHLSAFYKSWLSDSYRTQIRAAAVDAAALPGPGFDTRPSTDWCYFFEKSELALQLADWALVSRLGDQVQAAGYRPDQTPANAPREWLAFIEGYARSGRAETARDLTLQVYRYDRKSAGMLCAVWQGLEGAQQIRAQLRCSE